MHGTEGGDAKQKKKKVCLYSEELAWGQYRPAAPQTELTDVVVTDISLLTLPHARPYEYLLSVAQPAVMQFCVLYLGWGTLLVFQREA